jgi:hypothetical protein
MATKKDAASKAYMAENARINAAKAAAGNAQASKDAAMAKVKAAMPSRPNTTGGMSGPARPMSRPAGSMGGAPARPMGGMGMKKGGAAKAKKK